MEHSNEPSIYELLGGEAGLRALVKRFYEIMDKTPAVQTIRAMHPEDLASSEDKLFMFLSGWTGGPPLFHQKFGHPRLRFRHLPFAIGENERDQWMFCMGQALAERGVPEPLRSRLFEAFHGVADHMRNREG